MHIVIEGINTIPMEILEKKSSEIVSILTFNTIIVEKPMLLAETQHWFLE